MPAAVPLTGEAHGPRRAALLRLGDVRRRAEALDPRAFLAAREERVARELLAPLRALAAEAPALFEVAAGDDEGELGALAFAARLELKDASRLLSAEQSRENTLVACDIARQRLLRTGAAFLAAANGEAPRSGDEGRAAALVRALYMRLGAALGAIEASQGRRAVARVEAALGEMAARPEYADVRLSDRFVIESVRARLKELAREASPSPADVARLLSDVRAMTGLLASINRRPELREHDARLAALGCERVRSGQLPRAQLVQLRELLRGRDGALDAALADASRHVELPAGVRAGLAAELRRVADELAPAPPAWG